MAKMSIHIQDEIVEKIRPYKDMVNISKICATALLKEIEILSNVPNEVKNMQTLILRLRRNMGLQKKESFNLGVVIARLYTKDIKYDELKDWGSRSYSKKENYYFPEEVEDKIERYLLEEENKINDLDRESFAQGWLTVMKNTWEMTKNKI